ncbi:MAG: glycosyltransferase [Methylococcaceae bacterium]
MKISLVIPSFYPAVVYGGPIFSTLHTCQELSKLDDTEIYVSTTNANMTSKLDVVTNKWQQIEKYLFVKYYNTTINHTISLSMYFFMWSDIKKADVVHIQSVYSFSTIFGLLYSKVFKKPVLLSPRGQFGAWCLENGSSFKKKWLDWFIKPFAYKVIWHATAEQEKDEILTIFPGVKIEVIPNGIEYAPFQNSNLLSKNEFVQKFTQKNVDAYKIIVSMGRLQKKKGFDILIDSFLEVLKKYPNIKLFIAGQDEGEEANLKNQIIRLGLEDKAFLIGPISGQDKIDFLANADLFVLPSHNENFGNVYVESLAAGTPVVASKNTPWQVVEDSNCGKWVSNTIDDTSQAVLELLEKDRELMRINSKALANKYEWKNIAIQFKNLFQNMLTI